MKKKPQIPELKLPCFRGVAPQLDSPELGMDDYYKAVVMVHQSMPCRSEPLPKGSERFVIREDGEPFSGVASKA